MAATNECAVQTTGDHRRQPTRYCLLTRCEIHYAVLTTGDHRAQLLLRVGPLRGGLHAGQAAADRGRGLDWLFGSHLDRHHVQGEACCDAGGTLWLKHLCLTRFLKWTRATIEAGLLWVKIFS